MIQRSVTRKFFSTLEFEFTFCRKYASLSRCGKGPQTSACQQKGDIKNTLADITETKKYLNFKPKAKLYKGISKFIEWYKNYY